MSIEKKRLEFGIKKCEMQIMDLEIKIQEKLEDIERNEEHILLQKKKIAELMEELKQ